MSDNQNPDIPGVPSRIPPNPTDTILSPEALLQRNKELKDGLERAKEAFDRRDRSIGAGTISTVRGIEATSPIFDVYSDDKTQPDVAKLEARITATVGFQTSEGQVMTARLGRTGNQAEWFPTIEIGEPGGLEQDGTATRYRIDADKVGMAHKFSDVQANEWSEVPAFDDTGIPNPEYEVVVAGYLACFESLDEIVAPLGADVV